MNITNRRNQLTLAVACAMALGFPAAVSAQQILLPVAERDLVTTSAGQVWMNGFGECWHSGTGPAPTSSQLCDPNFRRPVAQVIAPAPVVAQAPVVAPPAPAPRAAPVLLPQPVTEKLTLSADALFDFDKAVLRPEGRTALDELVARLRGVEIGTISTIGHTDRIGTNEYNQALSNRRAAAVKTYLVEQGIQGDRVVTEGRGETEPVASSAQCVGGASAKVIACLQPDRRVDIDFVGSRTTMR